jgi:hypothetical protein
VNSQQARQILLACRPGTADEADPDVRAALALVERDPELAAWWHRQQQVHAALRGRFRELPVPASLKAEIVAAEKIIVAPWWQSTKVRALALAAALVGLLTVLLWPPAPEVETLDQFRERMVRTVIREYRMDLTTAVESDIRDFLRANEGHPEFQLRGAVGAVPLFGAGRLSWRGNPVSMICLERRPNVLMYLFVIERSALDVPPGEAPEFVEVVNRATASWAAGNLVYVLASEAGAEDLRTLLP